MEFNKYQWNLYLKAGGEKTVRRFEDFLNGNFEGYPEFVKELVGKFCPDDGIVHFWYEAAQDVVEELEEMREKESMPFSDGSFCPDDSCENKSKYVYEMLENDWRNFTEDNSNYKRGWEAFGYYIPDMIYNTQILAYSAPKTFFPYYYMELFNVLCSIADMFEIELPPIPEKKQYVERIKYYGDLCVVLYDFANENKMTPAELWAFLYDYAPACVGGTDWICEDIPEPRRVFVFGYGPDYPEKEPGRKWICQGNPEMQPGDIGLLYHWAPDSCYTSIWRAVSLGYYDPLAMHDRYVCYGHPILIPRVTFADLKADPVFKETTLVRQKMLRMDGAPMLPSEYMHLLDMARAKGELPDNVPTFSLRTEAEHGELLVERDVEEQLLEPLLLRLGWKPENWCRQMPVRVGRGVSKYPDYVVNPVYTKYNERGEIILEAKLSIPGRKQAEHDRGQAYSYAKLLGARAYVLVAREGIWISERDDGFSEMAEFAWHDMEDEDVFSEVYRMIGNLKKNGQKKNDKRRI